MMMTRSLRILLVVILILTKASIVVAEPKITAASYILLEAGNNQVLLEGNAKERRSPASVTKILTGILAIDLADVDELTIVSPKAARIGEASIYLQPGEIFSLHDLLKGALIKSGNDATVAIAEQVAGDEKLFLDLSNRKARVLGAVQTEFYNPHGLPHEQHLSTAQDLALIAGYSLKNPLFADIVSTKEATITSVNTRRKVYLTNTNQLLWDNSRIKGIKTGTTVRAGKCLVSAAEIDDRTLIAVVLKSHNRFGDSQRLLDWGFEEFSLQGLEKTKYFWVFDVPNASPACITVKPVRETTWSIPKGKAIQVQIELPDKLIPPIKKDEKIGSLTVSLDGQLLAVIPLIAGETTLPLKSIKNFKQSFKFLNLKFR